MRNRWVQIDGKLVPHEEYIPDVHLVMPDIQPYVSMIDGTQINSRSQHRDHLRQHNKIEVGNEINHLIKPRQKTEVPGRLELIKAQVNEMTRDQLKQAVKKDVDFIKWNSRGKERA